MGPLRVTLIGSDDQSVPDSVVVLLAYRFLRYLISRGGMQAASTAHMMTLCSTLSKAFARSKVAVKVDLNC